MSKLTIIYGNARQLIDEKIKSIYSNHQQSEIIKLDAEEDILDTFFNHIQMPSLFNESKLIVVKNASFLKSGNTLFDEKQIEQMKKIFENNPNLEVIFTINSETIDSRKKLIKLADEVIELSNKDVNIKKWIIEFLKESELLINYPEVDLIIYRVGKDLLMLENELTKLILYKETGTVTAEDINKIMSKNSEETVFDLIDATLENDKVKMIEFTNILIDKKEEVVKIYITLANQYRLMLDVLIYRSQGLNAPEIASRMKAHPYRVELAIKKLKKFDEDMLRTFLHDLYELDVKVKSEKNDSELLFKQWLLNL